MFGLQTEKQSTTKSSPFYMMFGREARYPSQIPEEYLVDSSVESAVENDSPTEDIINISDALQAARHTTATSHIKNQKTTKSNFKVGDKVWRLNVRSQQRKGGKLEPDFLGPFKVIALQDKSADLESEGGRVFPKINTDHLKIHIDEKERIPHKILNSTGITSISASIPASTPTPASSSTPTSTPTSDSTTIPASTPASTLSYTVSATTDKCVMDAWKGKNPYILLSKVGPYKQFYADIARTAPNMQLESEVQGVYIGDSCSYICRKQIIFDTVCHFISGY
ncbi:uncharacterized protein LOC114559226 [Perca flavescens]|uniref:uncharacterized protein LOC114559226 n=1 Tax=Perca flavescens TaxID=8167 RepID=UPI00106E1244|nr:uncharacterized protein LOC114559226 [Perca flavescens]